MVPQSHADSVHAEELSEGFGRLRRALHLGQEGTLVSVLSQGPGTLRLLTQELLQVDPALQVAGGVGELHEVPAGSLTLWIPTIEQLPGMNFQRPVVSRLRLRLVIWLGEIDGGHAAFRFKAPDLSDWVSEIIKLPEVPERYAQRGLKAASVVGRGVCWHGDGLDQAAESLGWQAQSFPSELGWSQERDRAKELVAGPVLVAPSDSKRALELTLLALNAAEHQGQVVLDNPGWRPPGFWSVDAGITPYHQARAESGASSMLVALCGGEPSAVALLQELQELGEERILPWLQRSPDPGTALARLACLEGRLPVEAIADASASPAQMRGLGLSPVGLSRLRAWQPEEKDWAIDPQSAEAVGRWPEVEVAWRRRSNTQVGAEKAASLGSLAGTLWTQGEYSAARALDERVLEQCRLALGEEHPDTLTAMSNLAGTLQSLGENDEARELRERVLEQRIGVFGPEHGATRLARGNLASSLWSQGEREAARTLREGVLERSVQELGPEHADTLNAMNDLAVTLMSQGEYAAARALQERVVALRRQAFGANHPGTLTAMNNLAGTLGHEGKRTEAKSLQEQVLERSTQLLGVEHPDTLSAMSNLASTLWALGENAAARDLEERVLELRTQRFGVEHPDTVSAMGNLAGTLRSLGELAAARALEERVLELRRQLLGERHPDTLLAMRNLSSTLRSQGEEAGARALEERVSELQTFKSSD